MRAIYKHNNCDCCECTAAKRAELARVDDDPSSVEGCGMMMAACLLLGAIGLAYVYWEVTIAVIGSIALLLSAYKIYIVLRYPQAHADSWILRFLNWLCEDPAHDDTEPTRHRRSGFKPPKSRRRRKRILAERKRNRHKPWPEHMRNS